MALILRYWPLVRDLLQAIVAAGGDPAVELKRIRSSYDAKSRAEDVWDAAMREKWP